MAKPWHFPSVIHMTPQWFYGLESCGVGLVDKAINTTVCWAPARPLGFCSIQQRLRAAWLVFIGRADALIWPENFTQAEVARLELPSHKKYLSLEENKSEADVLCGC